VRGERDSWLRNGEIPASALRTCFREAGIHMEFRTKFHIIASTAGVAKKRLTSRGMAARITKFHDDEW
jgi:hypothetical protein